MRSASNGKPCVLRAGRRWRDPICLTGIFFICLALACYGSYRVDRFALHRQAIGIVSGASAPSQKVLKLNDWLFRLKGTQANRSYFVWPRLSATPMQVLESGGDCADKSRLLTAMLRELNIESTMVMCFDRETQVPTHTVVEAAIEEGQYMVIDPAYGLHFPKVGSGGYADLLELRRDPGILDRRLDELLLTAHRRSPIPSYRRAAAAYDHAASFNWKKNAFTRFLFERLHAAYGESVYRISRPLLLEEPKLSITLALATIGVLHFAVKWRLRPGSSRVEIPNNLTRLNACGP